jgi:LPS O-antigen subunit length determinant protein (WzzB/FepE family)
MNESQPAKSTAPYDDEVDLRGLFRVMWAGKWLIGGITFAATVIAVVVALMLPNIYRAEALAQYGSLASLAGINLGGGQRDKTVLGLEVLKSRKFLSEFVERHDILVPLIAAKGWDRATGHLEIDSDDYDTVSAKWVRRATPPKKTVPSSQEAYERFSDILSIGQDQKTGLVTVAVEHLSPVVAKQWVEWLVEDINSSIMRQDVAEAEQAIEYLHKQIENTSLADLQSVFFSLIEEQTKTVMLAQVTDEYLLRTLDPAVAPEMKTKPRRSLLVVVSTLLGSLLGVAVVFVSTSFRGGNT